MTVIRTARLTTKALAASAVAALACSHAAFAQEATEADMAAAVEALDAAIPGKLIHNPLDVQWSPGGADMRTSVVDAPELTSGQAILARVKKRKQNAWELQMAIDVPEAINKGDRIQVLYYVRTNKAPKGKDAAQMVMFLGRNVEPYDAVLIHEFEPGTEWEMKSVEGTADADFPAGKTKLEYQFGRAKQNVEIGPIYISKLD